MKKENNTELPTEDQQGNVRISIETFNGISEEIDYIELRLSDIKVHKDHLKELLYHSKTPGPLDSPEAQVVWKILFDVGWVDEYHQPKKNKMQSSILACVMGIKLNLGWKPFEDLWHIPNLSTKWCRAQTYKYFPVLFNDLKDLIGVDKV